MKLSIPSHVHVRRLRPPSVPSRTPLRVVLFLALFSGSFLISFSLFSSGASALDSYTRESFDALSSNEQLVLLRSAGESEGPQAVDTFLKRIFPDQPSDAHELVHVVGEAAFLERGYNGFEVCDAFMKFGCYHGVILEAIKRNGYSQDVMKAVAEGCTTLQRNDTTINACIHGIGHGLMWVWSYDLVASYEECDRMFTDSTHLFFCYDGVSMENVVRRGEQEGAVNQLESDDPFYPCDSVDAKYQAACVREHTHYARRFVYGLDTAETRQYCLHFTQEHVRQECYGAIGSALNQDFFGDPSRIIRECSLLGEGNFWCVATAASQYAFSAQHDRAQQLCFSLPDNSSRRSCAAGVAHAERVSLPQ